MVLSWETALKNYDYYANLAEFTRHNQYPSGFTNLSFNVKIDNSNLKLFEESFRNVIETRQFSRYAIIGEVCFWKLIKKEDPHSLTIIMLNLMKNQDRFIQFCVNLHNLAEDPTLNNFNKFRLSCGQNNGFAVPVTFLSFYRPSQYPMADYFVSLWWNLHKSRFGYGSSKEFIPYGRISGQVQDIENNWGVYLQWINFCQKYAAILTLKTEMNWRARDVEMAIFHNQQKGKELLSNLETTVDQIKFKEIQQPRYIKNVENVSEDQKTSFFCPKCNSMIIPGQKYCKCGNILKDSAKLKKIIKRSQRDIPIWEEDDVTDNEVNYAPKKYVYWSRGR